MFAVYQTEYTNILTNIYALVFPIACDTPYVNDVILCLVLKIINNSMMTIRL